MFTEVMRYALGRISGVCWLDDDTLLVASPAGLYRMDAATLEWSLLSGGVESLSVSADRTRLALGTSNQNRPLVMTVPDGKVIWEGPVGRARIRPVEISADGTQVAWAQGSEAVQVVNIQTNTPVHTLSTVSSFSGCQGIRFLSGGRMATWNSDGVVQIWGPDGEALHQWKHHRWVRELRELADDQLLLAATPNSAVSSEDDVHLWIRTLDGREVKGLQTPFERRGRPTSYNSEQHCAAVSPDGTLAVSAGKDSWFHLLRLSDGQQLAHGTLNPTGSRSPRKWYGYDAAWSPSGARFAIVTGSDANVGSASFRHSLQVFSADGERVSSELRFYGVAHDISVGSGTVAVAHEWGVDLHQGDQTRQLTTMNASAMALSPDGAHVVACQNGFQGIVKVMDTASGEVVATPKVQKDSLNRAVFAPDNTHYAISGKFAQVHKLGRKSAVRCDKNRPDSWGLAFSSDMAFAQGCWGGTVTVGDGKKFAPRAHMTTPPNQRGKPQRVWDCAFSPDGRTLAAACTDGIRLYDAQTGETLRMLSSDAHDCKGGMAVAWSPDGRFVASGHRQGDIYIWDAELGTLADHHQHGATVNNLCWGPDNTLYSAGEDGGARAFQRTAPQT